MCRISAKTDEARKPRGWRRYRPGLATQVLIGFVLGIGVGVFFGESAASLEYVGLAFIRLLQMTVLPYVVVSLVAGLGKLGAQDAKRLSVRGGVFVVLLWAIGLVIVALIPLAYPDWEAAAFFSSSLVEEPKRMSLLDLYFTSNPFEALATTIVPAVVLFSIALGAALIGVKNKERIIDDLSVIGDALSRVSGFVARLAPIGVFGIAAGAAGTIDFDDLSRIQVHLILVSGMALVLSFVVLPGLVALLTPIRPMQFLRRTWSALITAFATGSLFVVLPLLAEAAKDLIEGAGGKREESGSTVDVVIPTTYNFPSLGVLLSLSFMFFAGWFIGSPVPVSSYPGFLISGLFTMFGSATLAIPILLDQLQLPADLFQLYLALDVIVSRVGAALAAVHVTVLAVLAAFAMSGRIKLNAKKLLPFLGLSVGSVAMVLVGSSLYFNYVASSEYKGYRLFVEMEMAAEPVASRAYDLGEATFLVRDHRREEFSTRDALMSHGALRIGIPDVPYYERLLDTYLPQAEWEKMDSPRPFLRGDVDDLDAYIYTAEAGSAWTLIYPEFSVAVPKPDILSIPNAASVRIDDEEWHTYLNLWIRLKLEGGEIGELHDRWILGKEAKRGKPRWCVCREVLGWMD